MLKKASLALIINFTGVVLAYPLHGLLTHSFGAAGYGQIALFMVWTGLLRIPLLMGLDKAVLKTISIQVSRRAFVATGRTIRIGLFSLLINLLAMLALSYLVIRIVPGLPVLFQDHWLVMIGVTFLSALMFLLTQLMRAFGSVGLALMPQRILQPVILLLGLVTLLGLFRFRPLPQDYFYWYLIVVGTLDLLMTGYVLRLWFQQDRTNRSEEGEPVETVTYPSLMSLAVPLSMTSAMYVLYTQTDIVLLGFMRPPAAVGVYRIAALVSQVVGLPLTAVIYYLGPHVATLFANKQHAELQRLISRACCIVSLSAVPAAIMFSLFSIPIMDLFGPGFRRGAAVLVILCAGQAINSVAGPASNLLNMTGHERITVLVLALSNVLNVVLNIIGIHYFGIVGAAIATALSTTCWNVAMVFMVRKKLHMSTLRWWRDPVGVLIS